jgi:hypothetical protein
MELLVAGVENWALLNMWCLELLWIMPNRLLLGHGDCRVGGLRLDFDWRHNLGLFALGNILFGTFGLL